MKTQHIHIERSTTATPEALWSLLSDIETWSRWGPWDTTGLVRHGSPDAAGAGAIRRMTIGKRQTLEEVTAFEPGRRMGYRLVSGIPVRNYTADIELDPNSTGTRITWTASFTGVAPLQGALARRFMTRFITGVANRLAAAAEQLPTQTPHAGSPT